MREIKFRAWVPRFKKMGIVDTILIEEKGIRVGVREFGGEIYPYTYQLMQYTGYKDKNGVEIYEGDIVCGYSRSMGTPPYIFCIDFEFIEGSDDCCPGDGGPMFNFSVYRPEYLEVIGNKYENPGLLENEK